MNATAMSGVMLGMSHAATNATFTKATVVAVFASPRIRTGNLNGAIIVTECNINMRDR